MKNTLKIFGILLMSMYFVASCKKDEPAKATVAVTSISLNEQNLEKKAGETFLLVATVNPENATNQNLTWTSDNEDAATVDQDGLVTCKKQGNAKIKVTSQDGNKTAVCNVKVNPKKPITSLGFKNSNYQVVVGQILDLAPELNIVPLTSDEEVVWTSLDSSIATVDKNGVLTAQKHGKVTISADTKDGRFNGKTCEVTITQPYIELTTTKNEIKLRVNANDEDKEDIWIDLNANGKKDTNEKVTVFDTDNSVTYTKTAETIAIYGKVTDLFCFDNELTNLDVSKNTSLQDLSCVSNQLPNLDVSENTKLRRLFCGKNPLTNLDVSNNTKLEMLRCFENELTSLDVSNNTKLRDLDCANNPNLTCIKVNAEQKANIPSLWYKDDTASYNTTCD